MQCQLCGAQNVDDVAVCVACGATPTLTPRSASGPKLDAEEYVGRKISDRYEILSVLGRGGMGLVFKAQDLELGEQVAIKRLQPEVVGDPAELERLKREIITARKITHPNVIRIHDFGVADKEGFLSMEVLPGGSLSDLEEASAGHVPFDAALEIAIGVSEGLAAAHAQGVIHRDLKPQNILFDAAGRPKLVDFGLARLSSLTSRTIGFSGTPQYMSPESADGLEVTSRTDVYSLGVVLFQLFTGHLPFTGDTLVRLAMLHAKQAPPSPRSLRPDLPPLLESILLRCLEKDPQRRFADAGELVEALRAARDGRASAAMQAPPPPAPKPLAAALRPSPFRDDDLPLVTGSVHRKKSRAWMVVPVGVLAMLGGIALAKKLFTGTGPMPTPAPTAVAMLSATPAPAATPALVVTSHAATKAPTARPTAAPVAKRGELTVKAKPWANLWIDGTAVPLENDSHLRGFKLSPGNHTVKVTNATFGFSAERVVLIRAGRETTIVVDASAKKIVVQ